MNGKSRYFFVIFFVPFYFFIVFAAYYFWTCPSDDNSNLYEEITSAELNETPQQRIDPLIFEQLIFESSRLDRIIKECLGDVKDSLIRLDHVKKLKSDPVYTDLRNQCKGIYNEFMPIVKKIIEYCVADGKTNSWPVEDEAVRQFKLEYAERKNRKYIELWVWEIKNESQENDQTHTYVEMQLDGMGFGRIVQMKDNQKDGYYLEFDNQKPLSIQKVVNGKKIGLELSFHKGSDALQTFAYYVDGLVMGPAFYWDKMGTILQFEYFSQPTRRVIIWPPDIRLKNNGS